MNLHKEIYIFIGPPGAGKGSLSQWCMQKLGWQQLSTGALCRKHIADQTTIGKQIDFAIKSGKLIADTLITDMVTEWLIDNVGHDKTPVILDGFPRTVVQAEALDHLIKTQLTDCTLKVVKLSLPDEIIVQRLAGRLICQNKDCQAVYSVIEGSDLAPKRPMICDVCSSSLVRRIDDDATAIRERLKVYHEHEQKLLDYYHNNGHKFYELDVDKPLEKVFEDFKAMKFIVTV